VAGFSPAMLLTTRYLVDVLLPMLIIVVASLLTRPTDPARVARFYARLKTPVAATLEEDALEVERSYANPGRFDDRKLFPHSDWEFTRWNREDFLGFLGCCLLVGVVLVVFKFVLTLGS
jgi:SSS family solute:Na+ symporter